MNYTILWNKIVSQFNKNMNCKEEIVQASWELLFSTIFNYSEPDIDAQRSVKMGVMTKRADIVIKNDNEDLFVVELKRHTLHEGQEQLFSYLNQLKIDLGVLVCDKLYIYDYDFTVKDGAYKKLEIPFTLDNPNGSRFIELFSKENFDKQKIKEFIKDSNERKNAEDEIKKELSSKLIFDLLKNHFSERYPDIDTEKILSSFNISITPKSAIPTPAIPTTPNTFQNYSYSPTTSFSTKDATQFMLNGTPTGGKGPTVYASVKAYVESHTGISFAELQAAFPDYLAKPGFGKMIRRVEDVPPNEWTGNRFKRQPILLSDGTRIVVTNQWKPDNMHTFIEGVKKLGIEIKAI